jgi:hypothetical protein
MLSAGNKCKYATIDRSIIVFNYDYGTGDVLAGAGWTGAPL